MAIRCAAVLRISGTTLSGTTLSGTTLRGTTLRGTTLRGTIGHAATTLAAISEASKLAEMTFADWKSGKWKDGSWEWPVWRSLTGKEPFNVFHMFSRSDDCWSIDFFVEEMAAPKFDRKMKNPFGIYPTGLEVWSIHRQCLKLSTGMKA